MPARTQSRIEYHARVADPTDQAVPITSAASRAHADMVLYGLGLRGFTAELAQPKRSAVGSRFTIAVKPGEVDRARASLGSIWDAILSRSRDVDPRGGCVHCGYDTAGLPLLTPCPECGRHLDRAMTNTGLCLFCRFDVSKLPRGEVCPECGTDLDCVEAIRAGRGKSPPPRVDL